MEDSIAAGDSIISEDKIEGWAIIHMSQVGRRKNPVTIRLDKPGGKSMDPSNRARSMVAFDQDDRESYPIQLLDLERLNPSGFVPGSLKVKSYSKYHSPIGLCISEFRSGIHGNGFPFDPQDNLTQVDIRPNPTMIPNSRIIVRASSCTGIRSWKIRSNPCLNITLHFPKNGLGAEAKNQQENRNDKK